jgi:uncharacterized NAD-dependent epimerase/dehydratase family protein
MKNVAIYPFDKITRGLVKFRDQLDFQINAVIDFVFNIGEDAGENIEGKYIGIPVTDNTTKALEGIDTLIINSMSGPFYNDKYMKLYKEYEVDKKCKDLIISANKKGIDIICTHDITDETLKGWLQDNKVKIITYGKSDNEIEEIINEGRKIDEVHNAHRIAIYATRCCVGKYTTQMHLLKAMKQRNLKATALITEPVGELYGLYDADPIRYRMLKNPMRYVYYVETLVKKAELAGNDYIVMADQQSITSQYFIEEAASNISLLKAYNPDSIILVAGYDDDANIRDCMDIFRIYCDGKKPISILIPDRLEVTYGVYEIKTKEEIEHRKKELKSKFKIENVELVSDVDKILQVITR